MAAVHPELAFLLDGLVATPLAPLAANAVALIAAEPGPERPFDMKGSPRRRNRGEARHVLRQLHLIEQSVFYGIEAEGRLGVRIAALAKALKLREVAVLPAEIESETAPNGRLDHLLSKARQRAIKRFADVYRKALRSVRDRWQ